MSTDEILEKLDQRLSRTSAELSRSIPEPSSDRSLPEDSSPLSDSNDNSEQKPYNPWEKDEEPPSLSSDQSREYQSKAREKELQKERAEREKIRREGLRHRAEMDSILAGGSNDRAVRLRSGLGGPPIYSRLERDRRSGVQEHFGRLQNSSLPLEWSAWSEDQRWEKERRTGA